MCQPSSGRLDTFLSRLSQRGTALSTLSDRRDSTGAAQSGEPSCDRELPHSVLCDASQEVPGAALLPIREATVFSRPEKGVAIAHFPLK